MRVRRAKFRCVDPGRIGSDHARVGQGDCSIPESALAQWVVQFGSAGELRFVGDMYVRAVLRSLPGVGTPYSFTGGHWRAVWSSASTPTVCSDRKSCVWGKSGSGRVDSGGRGTI